MTAALPYIIRLVIQRSGSELTGRWIDPDGQEFEPFPLTLPLSDGDTALLRWYLEEYYQFPGAGDHVKAEGVEKLLKEWGSGLYRAVFEGGENPHIYRDLLDAVGEGRPGVITLGAADADVLVQPWEMMRDRRGPLAFQGITFRRQLTGAKTVKKLSLRLPLRVLLIVSRPQDVGFIDPRNSIPPVLDARDALGGQAVVEFCEPPTMARLEEMISAARREKRPYHIVHFDGHGTYLPLTGVGALVFEDEGGKKDLVRGSDLGDLLARLDVPLVLLEACRGADLSDKPVFGSVAPALLESGVGSVVAFSHSVHIRAAAILVKRFYRELVTGQSVGAALQEARAALHADRRRFLHLGPGAECIDLQDWFIPQLYQVGSDPALVADGAALPEAGDVRPVEPPLPGFPAPPRYRFHGRALELLELERAFRGHPAVLLSGMGGMGKTALAREAAAWWQRTGTFDRAVFISFEQKAGAENAVQLIGRALEGEDFSRRSGDEDDPEGQWQAAVRLFHRQRALVVWDNFESTLPIYQQGEQGQAGGPTAFSAEARARLQALYHDLAGGSPRGRLLVTCRPQETGLEGIKELALGGLKRPDSLHLLAAVLELKGISTDRKGYERAEIDALLDRLADHPLSIELVAPHLRELTPGQIGKDFSKLLEQFASPDAAEDRNKSLKASLAFSCRRLSEGAQAALPWLAWFEGGVFERYFLAFSQTAEEQWSAIRAELEATALVKVEELEDFNSPYLRFHPTLPFAARAADVPDPAAAEERFIQVYLAVMQAADKALGGRQPAAGITLMAREEANLRRALELALRRGLRREGQALAGTLREYLERAGRNRERDALAAWVRERLPDDVLDEAAVNATLDHAWTRFTQGAAQEAVDTVRALLARLESEGLAGGADPGFQIAVTYNYLGRILDHAGRPDLAAAPLREAIARFEQMEGEDARGNLSAALGDLANACSGLGRFDEALAAAERALAIDRELGRDREAAAGLGRTAGILRDAHRYAEAEARYDEAMRAARAAGDLELQGAILQHQGSLQREQGRHARAVELFKQAIALFQRANDTAGEMRTCNELATAERLRGELDAAEAWYRRSRELALALNDRHQLGIVAQNLGILYQDRAEAEERRGDRAARAGWLDKAIASVEESLAIKLDQQDQLGAASSYCQLGVLHREAGNFKQAEEQMHKGMQIHEALNHPDVWKDYANLALIASARGDARGAAEWQAKADTKYAEIERLERGEGAPAAGMDEQLFQFILRLAQVCYAARARGAALPPDAAEALAGLCAAPAPLDGVGRFLQAFAQGQDLPPAPEGLPVQIAQTLQALKEAIQQPGG